MEHCKENLEFDERFGVVSTDTHDWEEAETFPAIVQILKCKTCGEESAAWEREKETNHQ